MDAARRRGFLVAGLAGWLGFLLAVSCGAAAAAPAAWQPLPPGTWEQGARPDSGGRDAILILDEAEFVDRRDAYRQHRRRIFRILTERGRYVGRIQFDEVPDVEVLDLRARSVRRDGTITELAPDQVLSSIVRKSGGEELRRTSFTIPGIEPGCVIEYAYTVEGKLKAPPARVWNFQNPLYTVESRLRWTFIRGERYQPRWTTRQIGTGYVGHQCVPDCSSPREFSFTVRAIPGVADEPWAPPQGAFGPMLITYYLMPGDDPIRYWSRWKQALDRYAESFGEDRGELEEVIERAKSSSPDPEQQLALVFRWIRDRIRSTAELSWEELRRNKESQYPWGQNNSIEHLILRGKGSPYELNLAFSHAAQALGFESDVILVRDRRTGSFEFDLLGLFPGNPLTAVRRRSTDHWRFHQPASRFSVPGNVPWFERGGSGLMTGKSATLTLMVSTQEGLPGRSRWNVALQLDAGGNLNGRVSGALDGELARTWRATLWEEDPVTWANRLAREFSPDARPQLEFLPPSLAAPPESALTLIATANHPGAATLSGDLMTIEAASLVPWRLQGGFAQEHRSTPILLNHPRTESVNVEIDLAAVATVEELPEPREFRNEIGSWRTRWKRTPTGVRLERDVEVTRGEYSPRTYGAVREFFGSLAVADRELILLHRP